MQLTKKLENGAEIVLLYTRTFTWKDEQDKKLLNDSPKTGRVYRALKDPMTLAYYVSIDGETGFKLPVEGIRLSELTYSNSQFECDMVQITDDNIVDFDITADDYKKISDWVASEHSDFISKFEKTGGIDVVVSHDDIPENDPNLDEREDQEQFMRNMGERITDAIQNSIEPYRRDSKLAIDYISERDPMILSAISGLLVYITKIIAKEDNNITLPMSRELASSDELGMGANIYTAVASLENYTNTNKTVGGNKNSLNKAIFSLLLELSRINQNKNND